MALINQSSSTAKATMPAFLTAGSGTRYLGTRGQLGSIFLHVLQFSIIVVSIILIIIFDDSYYDFMFALLSIVLIGSIAIQLKLNHNDYFDPMIVCSFLYFLFFVLKPLDTVYFGGIFFLFTETSVNYNLIGRSLRNAILGINCFYIGYHIGIPKLLRPIRWNIGLRFSPEKLKIGMAICLLISTLSLLHFLIVVGGPITFIKQMEQSHILMQDSGRWYKLFGPIFVWSFIVWYALKGRYKPIYDIRFLVLLSISFIFLVFSGARGDFLGVVMAVLVMYWYNSPGRQKLKIFKGKRVLIITVSILICFSILFQAVRHKYSLDQYNFLSIVRTTIDPFKTYEGYLFILKKYDNVNNCIWGKDFLSIPLGFIPRLLWPSKPKSYGSAEYTKEIFGVEDSAMGYTILGELHRNYYIYGIIGGMIIFGFICKIFYLWVKQNTNNNIVLAVYGLFLSGFMLRTIRSGFLAGSLELFYISAPLLILAGYVSGEREFKKMVTKIILTAGFLFISGLALYYIPYFFLEIS